MWCCSLCDSTLVVLACDAVSLSCGFCLFVDTVFLSADSFNCLTLLVDFLVVALLVLPVSISSSACFTASCCASLNCSLKSSLCGKCFVVTVTSLVFELFCITPFSVVLLLETFLSHLGSTGPSRLESAAWLIQALASFLFPDWDFCPGILLLPPTWDLAFYFCPLPRNRLLLPPWDLALASLFRTPV